MTKDGRDKRTPPLSFPSCNIIYSLLEETAKEDKEATNDGARGEGNEQLKRRWEDSPVSLPFPCALKNILPRKLNTYIQQSISI